MTITLDDEVRYNVVRLDDPPRLFFDFSTTYAAPPLHNATLAFDDGDLVREIRLGRHPGQTTRVVLDIADVDSYNVYSLYNPYRLVVDTVPTASRQAQREPSEAPAIVAPAPDGALDVLLVAEGVGRSVARPDSDHPRAGGGLSGRHPACGLVLRTNHRPGVAGGFVARPVTTIRDRRQRDARGR